MNHRVSVIINNITTHLNGKPYAGIVSMMIFDPDSRTSTSRDRFLRVTKRVLTNTPTKFA